MTTEDKELRAIEREVNRMLNLPRPKTPKPSTPKPQTGNVMSEEITTTDLPTLRKNIREENSKARSVARKSLEHVRACGDMLIELKARVMHGSFRHELKTLGIEPRTASNYMKVASKWETVSHLNHGVKDALKLLTSAEEPPPAPTSAKNSPEVKPQPSPRSEWVAGGAVIEAEVIEPEAEDKPSAKSPTVFKDAPAPPAEVIEPTSDDLPSWSRLATQFFVLSYADKVAFLNHINLKFKP